MGCGIKRVTQNSINKNETILNTSHNKKIIDFNFATVAQSFFSFFLFAVLNLSNTIGHMLYLFYFGNNKENMVLKFDGANEEWESLAINQKNITINQESQALLIDKDMILITGGKTPNIKKTDEIYGKNESLLYLIKKNCFYPFPSLNVPRACHMMVNHGDFIYALGGKSENNENEGVTSSVERMSIVNHKIQLKKGIEELQKEGMEKLKWDEVEPFINPRYHSLCFIFKNEIYLMGGMGRNKKICKAVEKYNWEQNQWILLEWKLPFSIYSAAASSLNSNEILIIGGKNDVGLSPSLYQMDLEQKKYHSKGAFSFRVNPKILHFKDNLYIFGGDKEMSCEKLNPKEFISYTSSESYTSFINNDLSTFPYGQTTINIGEECKHEGDFLMKIAEHELKIDPSKNYDYFYTFGTPINPFILEFDIKTEDVKFCAVSLVLKFYYHGSAVRLNKFYGFTMGGIIPPHKKASKKTHLIDFRSMNSQKMAKANVGRCKAFMVGNPDDNRIYLLGGITFELNSEKHLASAERFDLVANIWEKIADMHFKRYNANGFIFKKKLYVFGGSDGHNYLDSVEVLSPIENKWETIHELKMLKPISNFTINFFDMSNGEFLFIGGCNKESFTNEILTLKMDSKKYEKILELKEPRSGHKVFVKDSLLIVLGGTRSALGVETLKLNSTDTVSDYKRFDETLNKYYKDNTLIGVQSC